jgi:signal transduction histidine kinase
LSPTQLESECTIEAECRQLRETIDILRLQLRLMQRLVSVGTMTAMVVHEFNNLLTPIVNYAQMAQANPTYTPKALERAVTGGKRAADICQAILGIVRNAAVTGPFLLGEMAEETLTAMAREPKRDGIDFHIQIPDDLVLNVRRVELQQVLLNLLINARQAVLAHPTPRRIEVAAESDDDQIFLRVTDNGTGIDPEILPRIFEPFFTTKSAGQGSGLGLALCKEIVENLGGTIDVESTLGVGATFLIRLPR